MMPPSEATLAYRPWSVLWLFLVPALGGFLFGYDIGGTSFVVVELASLPSTLPLSLQNAPFRTGWMVAAPSAGALFGTAVLSSLNMGRRTELWCAGILYAMGGFLQWAASSFWILSLGRCIYGAGIGFAMHGGPTYLAETTPSSIRGMVVGGKEICIVLGILAGYFVGYQMTTVHEQDNYNNTTGWAYVYAGTIFVSVPMILLSYTIPESARYLVNATAKKSSSSPTEKDQDRILSDRVLESLSFVWKPKAAEEERFKLMEIYHRHQQQESTHRTVHHHKTNSLRSLWKDPSVRPAFRAGLGLVVLQQITGQPSVLSYATPILANVPGLQASASVLLALFKVLATTVSVLLVETKGRKLLLTIGCWMMLAALCVMVVAFHEDDDSSTNNSSNNSRFVLLGMFAYIAGYQIGFGPITWLMISEVFPQDVRGKAVAVAVQANFALNALVQFLVPVLQETFGIDKTFGIFGILTAYSIWFVRHSVPETKGLTLEEIEDQLKALATTTTTTASNGNINQTDPRSDKDPERVRLIV